MMNNLKMDSRYAIPAGIKYRYEDFGGIVYRRQDDKLFFMNSRTAIDLLNMADQGTVREIVGMLWQLKVPAEKIENQVLKLLNSLKELGIIYEVA